MSRSIFSSRITNLIFLRNEAHAQIHGLTGPYEAYERTQSWIIATSIFEACAQKGFVQIVHDYPHSQDVLNSCTKCLEDVDRDYLERTGHH